MIVQFLVQSLQIIVQNTPLQTIDNISRFNDRLALRIFRICYDQSFFDKMHFLKNHFRIITFYTLVIHILIKLFAALYSYY